MKKMVVSIFLMIGLMLVSQSPYYADQPQPSKQLLYQDIFVSMLLPQIQQKISQYYSTLLTEDPAVYPYEIFVEHAKRPNGFRTFTFLVTLKVLPMIGPHVQVGVDQMVFEIDTDGAKLKKFKHIQTEQLPENWQHIIR